ncbi:MAG: hypothetical protein V3R45_05545 [Candidatus Aminicenantaceae bacterium]
MKIFIRTALVLSLVLTLSIPTMTGLFAQSQEKNALIGTWDVELIEMGMLMEFIFKMEDEILSGVLEFEMGSGVMEDLSFNDNKLTFSVSLDAGGQMFGLDVEGIVEDDTLTGTIFSEM